MDKLEKNDEIGSSEKIDEFMKDGLECESIEKITDLLTFESLINTHSSGNKKRSKR